MHNFLQIVKLIERRLENFNLKPELDIVNLTTKAKVMVKVGRLFASEHLLCIVHGLHLAVIEVLYKTQPKDKEENSAEATIDTIEDILEEDDDDESDTFIVEVENDGTTEPNELTDEFNLFQLITKI